MFSQKKNVGSGKVTPGYFLVEKRLGVCGWDFSTPFFLSDKNHSEVQQEKTSKQNQISPQYRGELCRRQVDIRDQTTSKDVTGGYSETIQIQRKASY